MVIRIFKNNQFGYQKPSWFWKGSLATQKPLNIGFLWSHPLKQPQYQHFSFQADSSKNGLIPSLFIIYHRNQSSRSQIFTFDPLVTPHPLYTITTKSPQTPKTGVIPSHFKGFHTLDYFDQTSPLTRYHRKKARGYLFLSTFKIAQAHLLLISI